MFAQTPADQPVPARGQHAELLNEIVEVATRLIAFARSELEGRCDGNGFWIGSDPILSTAQKLVNLAQQRS